MPFVYTVYMPPNDLANRKEKSHNMPCVSPVEYRIFSDRNLLKGLCSICLPIFMGT